MTPLTHRDRPNYVYILLDDHGSVIYVGCTNTLVGRRNAHRNNWWWEDVTDWRIIGPFSDRDSAETAERAYIAHYCPRHNVQGVPRERLHEFSETEKALAKAWLAYQHCLRHGRVLPGEESTVASALSRIDRLRRQLRRERLTVLQGGAA